MLISPEDDNAIGFLIRDEQEPARRIDAKVARCRPASFFMRNGRKAPFPADREKSDTVMPAIRTVNKSPIGRNMNVGARIGAGEIIRQAR